MITSASNTRIKKVAALNQKAKERRQEGRYVVEGVKMFLEAPEEEIEEVYVSEGFHNPACDRKLNGLHAEQVNQRQHRRYDLPDDCGYRRAHHAPTKCEDENGI